MDNQPLVSIITPCYNGEEYIAKYLESVMAQTYRPLELILINDGSTDRTEEIALSFQEDLKNTGISFQYYYQKNAGQASAINVGLSIISGTFLTWPDCDDWMHRECIEKKVDALKKHPEWAAVCCKTAVVEYNSKKELCTLERKSKSNNHFFEDLIMENDVYFAPGGYLVRTNILLGELHNKSIYVGRGGQNWQLLLPIAFNHKFGFIDDTLYYYLLREDSHSHAMKSYEEIIRRTFEHEKTLTETISRIKMREEEKQKYIKMVEEKYILKRYNISLSESNRNDSKKYYLELKQAKLLTKSIRLEYWRRFIPFLFFGYRLLHFPIGLVNRIQAK